ncbi:Uncharacterized protein TCM_021429 [Theobroma cacao]|uniref:Uncharacterized protein n=1 Tax=Theobroma cacao TaxID=3641 RepID=A0A061ER23_THECC|nr:Uncharacterized protein TCM_021429 [Theobroma cacao]
MSHVSMLHKEGKKFEKQKGARCWEYLTQKELKQDTREIMRLRIKPQVEGFSFYVVTFLPPPQFTATDNRDSPCEVFIVA